MADRSSASITVGGDMSAQTCAELARIIAAERLSIDWNEAPFEPEDRTEGEPLRLDSNDLHIEAWHQIFAESGHEIDRARIHGQIGKGGDNLVPALLPELGKPEQKTLADGHGRLFKQLFRGG